MPSPPTLPSALQLTSSLLRSLPVWLLFCTTGTAQQQVVEVLDDGEMPPSDAEHQPPAA